MRFGLLDWAILVAYLAISVGVGLRARRYVEDLSGYMVAGRRVRTSLGITTFIATELGTVTFVYFGELGYVAGFSAFIVGLLAMAAYTLVGRTGFVISGLRALRVMTIPEFYELRYSRRVRLVGGTILFVGGVLNMGVFLKFDGIFLSEVMGFGPDALATIMAVMLVIVVLYTVLGGMFSIVITDYLQFLVLTVSMLVATVAVLTRVSPEMMGDAVTRFLGPGGTDPLANSRFGWPFFFWVFMNSFAAAALWQPATSKALASESPAVARRVFFFSGLTWAGRAMIPMFWGVAALAYFGDGIPAAAAMPRLLGLIVPAGFLGLLVAGLLAASMSTYSAYLLAWSAVFTRDVLGPARRSALSDAATVRTTRVTAIVIGIFLLVFGLAYAVPDTAFQYLYVTGAMYTAGALGCVAAGLYWPRANSAGAYAALLMGAAAPAIFLAVEKFRDQLPPWLWWAADVNIAGMISFLLAAAGMIFGSLLTARRIPPRPLPAAGGEP